MIAPEKAAELDPVAVGAEIGAALWRGRCFSEVQSTDDALAWVRGSRAAVHVADADEGLVAPGALLSALLPSDGSGQPIAGVLEVAARELRMALSWLDGAKLVARGRGYEPKEGDIFETLLGVERRVAIALRAVHLESRAAALAIHGAAHGAVPEAVRAPNDRREDVPPTTIERVGRQLGAGPGDVAGASAVARVWGLGDLGEPQAERLLVGLGRLRAELAEPTAPTAPTTGGSSSTGGACEPGRRGFWGHWRMRSARGSAVTS